MNDLDPEFVESFYEAAKHAARALAEEIRSNQNPDRRDVERFMFEVGESIRTGRLTLEDIGVTRFEMCTWSQLLLTH